MRATRRHLVDEGWIQALPVTAPNVISISPVGDLVATSHDDGRCLLWDSRTGKLVLVLDHRRWLQKSWPRDVRYGGRLGRAIDISWSPSGEALVVGYTNGVARLWSIPASLPLDSAERLTELVADRFGLEVRDGLLRKARED